MNKLIDGLFIVAAITIIGIAIMVGLFARDIYKQSKAQNNCPVPVDFIPTDVKPKEQIGREI